MGLFDRFLKKPNTSNTFTPTSELEAAFAILYSVVTVDGVMTDAESSNLIRGLIVKKRYVSEKMEGIIKRVTQLHSEIGSSGMIKASAQLIPESFRPTIFCLAVEAMMADGDLGDEELEIVEYIASEFGLDDELSKKIIHVLFIKNEENIPFE